MRSLGLLHGSVTDVRIIVARGRTTGSADADPIVTTVKTGGTGLKRKGWSTGNSLYAPSGVPIQRPGVRSLRSTLTNLPLITAPIKQVRAAGLQPACNTLYLQMGAALLCVHPCTQACRVAQ